MIRAAILLFYVISVGIAFSAELPPPKPKGNIYHEYVYGHMSNFNEGMISLYVTAKLAKTEDLVVIHIDSPGGEVDPTLLLINAIENSKATFVAINEGLVASAATMLAVNCDYVFSKPKTVWMFHMASIQYNPFPNVPPFSWLPDMIYMPDADDPEQFDILNELKDAPLNPKEWERMTKGKEDVYIGGEDMNQRFENKNKNFGTFTQT